ncbi:hypothetical protein D3C85_1316750 [compost metagenome]
MRGLGAAGLAQRQIERVTAVDVLGQPIDRRGTAGHQGKGLGREQVPAQPQRLQPLRDLLQLLAPGVGRNGRQPLRIGDEGAHGPCAFGVLALRGRGR